MCRAMVWVELFYIGFPKNRIMDRVNEAWPGHLAKVKDIIKLQNLVFDHELDGETTKEAMESWMDTDRPQPNMEKY